ncbi:Carbohydrate-binding domain family 9-like protein, partial [Metarhizium majus ARSEF 297]
MFPSQDTSLCEAALASVCPSDSVCFQWGVPESSSGSESGAMYLQLQASPSYQWIGLGTGSRMRGSNMLVVYQNGHSNVTLSTRQSTGHSMPTYAQRPDVQLLEGSGVLNGTLRANIRCGECSDASVGGLSNWIAAWKSTWCYKTGITTLYTAAFSHTNSGVNYPPLSELIYSSPELP